MADPLSQQNLYNRIATEGITDNSGNQLMTGAIAADIFNKQAKAASLPTFNPPTTPVITPPAPVDNVVSPDMKAILDSYQAPTKVDYAGMETQAGIPEKTQEVANLTNQINAIMAQQRVQEAQIGKEAISAGAIQGRNLDLERQNYMTLQPLQVQLAIKQGDLTQAQAHLDKMFTYEQEYQKAKTDFENKKIDAVYDIASKKEQRLLDEKKLKNEQDFQIKQDQLNTINNLAQSYPDAGITATDTLEQAQKKVSKSPSFLKKQVESSAGGLSAAQINSTVNSIRGAFDNEPIVKNFNVIAEGKAFVDSLPTETKNPADDQALIYALAKALDPNSVVREGEYATAQKYSQSWVKAYGSGVNQAITGTGFLSKEARNNIKATINSRYQASLKNYENVRNEYQRQIDDARAGVSPTITDYSKAYPTTVSNTQANQILTNIIQKPNDQTTGEGFSNSLLGKAWNWLTKQK